LGFHLVLFCHPINHSLIICRKGVSSLKKENGRLKPSEDFEKSSSKGKPFKCNLCNNVLYIKNPEFGAHYICTQCDTGVMEEV